ncbi:Antirestriction protein domain-containing protein [Desulfonema limicola]|uniref:Antirestriction protein domain-containing protein n=1 Tax=Desulfonema limicola TaxID=45656 RepID=A0A975BC57_9BACT|nr:antirestriction protein ArdA [Desulfonema limicola]QTA82717.1 Antirestriction protein domain-containing protein [Desulfonema limicola]
MATNTPKIYVACLSSYNSGILHGEWIDANQDEDDIQNEIQEMLKQSPVPDAEEWAIHDFEGFYEIRISEYEDIETVSKIAQNIEAHGEAYASYISDMDGDVEDDIEKFEEAYRGEYKNKKDFAYQLMHDCYTIPEFLESYIDYESYARDLFICDYSYACSEGRKIFVFMRI